MPTILIVDDEKLIRNMLKTSLGRIGYEVLEAENGKKAMEIIKGKSIQIG